MPGSSPESLSGPARLREITRRDLLEDIRTLQADIGLYTRLKAEAETEEDRIFLYQLTMDAVHLLQTYHAELAKK